MKLKTSITLSEDVVSRLKQVMKPGESRSQAVERLLRVTLAREARKTADLRDLAVINEHAEALNAEAEDVLSYQADV